MIFFTKIFICTQNSEDQNYPSKTLNAKISLCRGFFQYQKIIFVPTESGSL